MFLSGILWQHLCCHFISKWSFNGMQE